MRDLKDYLWTAGCARLRYLIVMHNPYKFRDHSLLKPWLTKSVLHFWVGKAHDAVTGVTQSEGK